MISNSVKVVNNYIYLIYFCLLIYFITSIKAIDNKFNYAVENLQCNEKKFNFFLKLSPNFNGVIFGKAFFQEKNCKWYNNQDGVKISIGINMCGIKKNGNEYELSLIMSPEKNIIVEGAKEILLKCLPTKEKNFENIPENDEDDEIVISLNSSQNISSKLKFTPITTSTLTGNGSATKVSLQILRQHNMKGSLAKDAKIGELLTMNVHLEDTKLYNIMLSDCYAHDGKGNDKAILKIIDSQGCGVPLARAVEENVTTQTINGNEKNIFINIYGFQFTSSNNVFFECKVKTCIQPCFVKQCEDSAKNELKGKSEEKDFTNLVVKYMLEMRP